MHIYLYLSVFILTFPSLALAQTTGSLQTLLANILVFINETLIPFLFGIAFLFFVINVIRYFVAGAGNEDSREKAKSLATYSVAAFVFLIIFWGLVNMLADSTGLLDSGQPCPDYMEKDGVCPNSIIVI